MNKLLTQTLAFVLCSLAGAAVQAQELKGSAVAGEKSNAMCIGCHGINGYQTGFPEVYRVPKISGQSAKYIEAALMAYQSGERKHPSMQAIALSLSKQEIANLGAYYESMAAKPHHQPNQFGKAEQAKALIQKGGCVACHGENFSKPIAPNYPKVAGQYADYIYTALRAYKNEKKPQLGRANPTMMGIAKQFSDDELKLMAGYIESLPGELVTVQQARFR